MIGFWCGVCVVNGFVRVLVCCEVHLSQYSAVEWGMWLACSVACSRVCWIVLGWGLWLWLCVMLGCVMFSKGRWWCIFIGCAFDVCVVLWRVLYVCEREDCGE